MEGLQRVGERAYLTTRERTGEDEGSLGALGALGAICRRISLHLFRSCSLSDSPSSHRRVIGREGGCAPGLKPLMLHSFYMSTWAAVQPTDDDDWLRLSQSGVSL